MILEALKKLLKGKICITDAITGEILLEKDNAIQPFADQSMAKLLAGDLSYMPSIIGVYLAGVNIANSANPFVVTNGTTTSVLYSAYFSDVSFTGAIDELRLQCGVAGSFSIVTGLSFVKSSAVYITWTLNIA